MKFLVNSMNTNLDITPDGICGKLNCDGVACGVLDCVSFCDCRYNVMEPWGNDESLF